MPWLIPIPLEDPVGDGDVAKVSAALRTAFDVDAGGAEDAVVDGDVLGYAALAEGTAGLEADGVVVRFDEAVGDADVTRAVRVDTVGEAALNADRVDLDKAAAEQTDVVVWRVAQGNPAETT